MFNYFGDPAMLSQSMDDDKPPLPSGPGLVAHWGTGLESHGSDGTCPLRPKPGGPGRDPKDPKDGSESDRGQLPTRDDGHGNPPPLLPLALAPPPALPLLLLSVDVRSMDMSAKLTDDGIPPMGLGRIPVDHASPPSVPGPWLACHSADPPADEVGVPGALLVMVDVGVPGALFDRVRVGRASLCPKRGSGPRWLALAKGSNINE